MKKYYAVKIGKKPGIYETWDACKQQVDKYSGAVYKSFKTLPEAKAFISEKKEVFQSGGLIAYVDGSYNVKTKEYGYGCVFIEGQRVIKEVYGKGNEETYISMRNVSGEILGSEMAVRYAIDHQYQDVYIYYDYEGIEKWAMGIWRTNKPGTIAYAKTMKEYMQEIRVHFIKVAAHTGDLYNERADMLAKKAVGVIS